MKPIHPDYPSRIKALRRQPVMSREDLSRELGVKLNGPNYYGGLLVEQALYRHHLRVSSA